MSDDSVTVDITPNYKAVRALCLEQARRGSLRVALTIAYELGSEAPTLREICEAADIDTACD